MSYTEIIKSIDEAAEILYENYVKEKSYSIIDRLSRVTNKELAVSALYDALRGIRKEGDRTKFQRFIDNITEFLEKNDVYPVKLLALKAISRGG